jgi:sulfur carrier protein ThiS
MNPRVTLELWMWLGKELGEDFRSVSDMCSVLKKEVAEGTTVKELFADLAGAYPPIGEKIFDREKKVFNSNVIVMFNERVIASKELHERILKEGDHLRVMPIYVGG